MVTIQTWLGEAAKKKIKVLFLVARPLICQLLCPYGHFVLVCICKIFGLKSSFARIYNILLLSKIRKGRRISKGLLIRPSRRNHFETRIRNPMATPRAESNEGNTIRNKKYFFAQFTGYFTGLQHHRRAIEICGSEFRSVYFGRIRITGLKKVWIRFSNSGRRYFEIVRIQHLS